MSNPAHPSGISEHNTSFVSVSELNSFPITVSSGNTSFTPFCLAFFINSNAKSHFSGSHSEFPTSYPNALKNVYAIPPPISILPFFLPSGSFAFSIRLSITAILSDTFEPPSIASNGLTGLFNAFPKKFNSFSINSPATDGK